MPPSQGAGWGPQEGAGRHLCMPTAVTSPHPWEPADHPHGSLHTLCEGSMFSISLRKHALGGLLTAQGPLSWAAGASSTRLELPRPHWKIVISPFF